MIDAFKWVVHNHSDSLFFPNTLDIDDLKHQFIKYSTMILQAVFVQSNTHHEQGW